MHCSISTTCWIAWPKGRKSSDGRSSAASFFMNMDVFDEARRLAVFYEESEALLAGSDAHLFVVVAKVSGWSVAQQLFHSWKAAGQMLNASVMLHRGHGPINHEAEGPNRIGRIVLAQGRFPRGRAEAPAALHPPEDISRETLQTTLDRSRAKSVLLNDLLPTLPGTTGRLEHPYFGPLSATEWLCAARIHSDHHLAIIRDILKEAGGR